jgi:membrane protein implicated in regulation of membrane protease activity
LLWMMWIVIAALFVVLELNTGTFYVLILAIAALIAMIAALVKLPLLAQCFVFAGAALLLYVFLMPILRRLIPRSREKVPLVTDALIGQTAYVTGDIIPGEGGLVRVNGDVWSATSDAFIASGEKVTITEVKVTKLHVRKE